jgi:hypothetical protein
MLAKTQPHPSWSKRRTEKQRRLAQVRHLASGTVLPTDDIVSALELLIAPGDRVVLEGNNQKQADFLSRALARVDPVKVNNLNLIMPSVSLPEHLDLFERASPTSWISPMRAGRACAFPSSCRMACWKSVPSIPMPNCMRDCTST